MRFCNFYKHTAFLLFFLGATIGVSDPAAAEFGRLAVSPALVETRVRPGDTGKGHLKIINTANEDFSVAWDIDKLHPRLPDERNLANYIVLSREAPLLIPANSEVDVDYVIHFPEDAVGEYAAMIFFKEENEQEKKKSMFRVRFGVAVYASAQGTERVAASIESVNMQTLSQGGHLKGAHFRVLIKNEGNVHIRPSGKITIYCEDRPVDTVELMRGWPVFVDASHEMMYPWEAPSGFVGMPGTYRAQFDLDYGRLYDLDDKRLIYNHTFEYGL